MSALSVIVAPESLELPLGGSGTLTATTSGGNPPVITVSEAVYE